MDDEVAERWLRLFPLRRTKEKEPEKPTAEEIKMITGNQERIEELRCRLSGAQLLSASR